MSYDTPSAMINDMRYVREQNENAEREAYEAQQLKEKQEQEAQQEAEAESIKERAKEEIKAREEIDRVIADKGEGENVINEVAINDIKPIGKGVFGNIYDQFKGKAKEAFEWMFKHKEGDLLGVFHRNEIGDIDLIWGSKKKKHRS